MRPEAFTRPGRFFRGNLHTHSDRSDGALDPQEVCRRYMDQGYDFIALTDHLIGIYNYPITETHNYRTGRFTTILGAEVHSGALANGEIWHLVAVGLPQDFERPAAPHFMPVAGQETGAELAARARAAGAFVAIAHPQWSGLTMDDARSIGAAHAVEIYNHGCAVACDRQDGLATLDLLLSEGRRLDLIATDDAHFTDPDQFGGWVEVKAEENDPEALLAALKDGAYFASQGPRFVNVETDGKFIHIESSPVVTALAVGQGSASAAVHGHSMTRARIPLNRFAKSPWIRVTVIDAAGRRAWTNPIWLT